MLYYRHSDGKDYPITKMYDIDGDETDDPETATCIVAKGGDHSWWTVDVTEGDIIRR